MVSRPVPRGIGPAFPYLRPIPRAKGTWTARGSPSGFSPIGGWPCGWGATPTWAWWGSAGKTTDCPSITPINFPGTRPLLGRGGIAGKPPLEVGFAWENPRREEDGCLPSWFPRPSGPRGIQRWKEAYWDYQEASLLKPADPLVIQERATALKQYNLQRAETYFQRGGKDEGQGYFMEAKRDYEWAVSLGPAMSKYAEARGPDEKGHHPGPGGPRGAGPCWKNQWPC